MFGTKAHFYTALRKKQDKIVSDLARGNRR